MPISKFLPEDRFFQGEPERRKIAMALYARVRDLPIVSPHGHVDPRLLSDESISFGTPADLFIIPDHYVYRMLYSQGIPLERLGVPRVDGGPTETDHRKIWQLFADNFHLFRGTPSGIWLKQELHEVFGVEKKLDGSTAQEIYDELSEKLDRPEFRPRALFERSNIEVLCTTDSATDPLAHHQAICASGWKGQVRPTFRPDALVDLRAPGWSQRIADLSAISGIDVRSYADFIRAIEDRRAFFKRMGATATDHAAMSADTAELAPHVVERIFQRAWKGEVTVGENAAFAAHMLSESARMSVDDGLVMQLHVGALRNHNPLIFQRFGLDKGCDIPTCVDFTHGLQPLLAKYGNEPRLSLLLFSLDDTCYARELAPLAGHYPVLRLGPPWWFFDSLNGMARYFDDVVETAGIYNTAGFNDDTRAFPSIPARHDVWRRASADWLAGLAARKIVDEEDAAEMIVAMAYGLAKSAYRL